MSPSASPDLDVAAIKADFPLLKRTSNDHTIVYLDSASSSQKPSVVLDTMTEYYETINANVHRGAYQIADLASRQMEAARANVADFIGATNPKEIVFTRNATESINLVSNTWGRANLNSGDAVLLTELEHHANIVPWQMLAAERDLEIRWVPLGDDGQLDLSDLDRLLDGVKLFAFSAMSNVLGTITPVRALTDAARAAGAVTVVDASQYVPHLPTDVVELGADFFAFTGHKMLGPTGVGVLWARYDLLDAMPPFLGGGSMILQVTKEGFTTNEVPLKFEAGTPAIAEIIGLGAAVDYLRTIGMDAIRAHEVSLTAYALRTLTENHGDRLTIHGPSEPATRGGVLSFELADVHPHDVSQVLDQKGVCIRAGHHCAKPLMAVLGVNSTSRASLYLYNDESDVDTLSAALDDATDMFGL